MIEVKELNKNYQDKNGKTIEILNSINLEVATGEIFGIIGKSGAGKSTLLRCVNLLEYPSSGKVFVDHQELTALNKKQLRLIRRKIGMVFQNFNLLERRTVYQNISLPLELMGTAPEKIKTIIEPLLEFTGLTEKQKNYPSQLSGGQKQRVAITRALASQPKVLLCDEATSALDLQTTKSILKLLKDINQEFGVTILLITHELEIIKELTDTVALLDKGKIIEQAETSEFFVNPKTSIAQSLVRTALKQELPISLQSRLVSQAEDNNPVLQLLFHGKAAEEPLITYLGQEFGLKISILQGNIEFLKTTALGVLFVEILENKTNLPKAIQYLHSHGVKTEIIGYVARNH